jgi:glycerophosphoryl diester phosphodiesterase
VISNPWLDRRTLNFAHQGGAKEAPSSTMYAFHQAIRNGADALEMDVHVTSDGHLVVCHDETIDRTTQLNGRIDDLPLTKLSGADNAYWWVPGYEALPDLPPEAYTLRGQFPQEKTLGIARLEEVLETFPNTFLNFDIKGGSIDYELLLANCLRAYGRSTDVIVASFHDAKLQKFRQIAPEIHTSTALAESFQIAQAYAAKATPTVAPSVVAMQVPYRFEGSQTPLFDGPFVSWLHDFGLAIHVWTIDEAAEMHELLDLGVDAIISDCPSICEQVLTQRQAPRPKHSTN